MIEFTILAPPVAKGRPLFSIMGHGKKAHVHVRTPDKTAEAEREIIRMARPFAPRKPLSGPLHVTTVFVLKPPDRFDADRSRDWPHVKPDDDNYRKLVLDALNGFFWHDDAQVCGGSSFKIYGAPARTLVRIYQLGPADVRSVRELLGEPASPQPSLFGGES
jgi:Holliday junction resolvase RusA-like endonuclease